MLCGTDPKGDSLNTAKKRYNARTSDLIRRYQAKSRLNKQTNFIYGHTPLITNAQKVFNRNILHITMLRDPVNRFISHYRADINKNNSLKSFKEWVKSIESDNHNLGYSWVEFNHQTSMLSGYKNNLANKNDLEIAKQNLKNCTFIGLTEQFDTSVELFCKVFSLPYTYKKPLKKYKAKNIVPIDPSIIQYLNDKSHYDIELYEYAQKLFKKENSRHKNKPLLPPTNVDKYFTYPIKDVDYWIGKINVKVRNKIFNDIAQL